MEIRAWLVFVAGILIEPGKSDRWEKACVSFNSIQPVASFCFDAQKLARPIVRWVTPQALSQPQIPMVTCF